MSVEAPERIWVYKPERINKLGEIVSELLPVANSPEDYGEIEYVRADKLEELAANASNWEERFWKRDAQADRLMQERDKAETALAEAKRENEALRDQRNDWQSVAQHAGVCMTCAIRAPETYGCTDCLNTGWDGGSPAGFVRADKLEELNAENERLRGDCRAYEKTMQAIAEAENTALAERDREIAALREALEFYANPIVYAPHPHGPAFDRRDLSFMAKNVLSRNAGGNDAK